MVDGKLIMSEDSDLSEKGSFRPERREVDCSANADSTAESETLLASQEEHSEQDEEDDDDDEDVSRLPFFSIFLRVQTNTDSGQKKLIMLSEGSHNNILHY